MKPIYIRKLELKKQIDNLTTMMDEAKAEYTTHDDLAVAHRNKAEAAEKRMHDLNDEIGYRMAEINDLEELEAKQDERASA